MKLALKLLLVFGTLDDKSSQPALMDCWYVYKVNTKSIYDVIKSLTVLLKKSKAFQRWTPLLA